jgi:hypothetical protein
VNLAIHPLAPELWPALEDLFDGQWPVGQCWCMYWRIGNEYRKRPSDENKVAFCELVRKARLRACWLSTAIWLSAGAN